MHCWKQQQAQPRQEARSMLMQGLPGALACRVSKGVEGAAGLTRALDTQTARVRHRFKRILVSVDIPTGGTRSVMLNRY